MLTRDPGGVHNAQVDAVSSGYDMSVTTTLQVQRKETEMICTLTYEPVSQHGPFPWSLQHVETRGIRRRHNCTLTLRQPRRKRIRNM